MKRLHTNKVLTDSGAGTMIRRGATIKEIFSLFVRTLSLTDMVDVGKMVSRWYWGNVLDRCEKIMQIRFFRGSFEETLVTCSSLGIVPREDLVSHMSMGIELYYS